MSIFVMKNAKSIETVVEAHQATVALYASFTCSETGAVSTAIENKDMKND